MKMQELKFDARLHAEVYQRNMVSGLGVGLWPNLEWCSFLQYDIQLKHRQSV